MNETVSCSEVLGEPLLLKTSTLQHSLDVIGHLSSYKTGPLPHGRSVYLCREQKQFLNVLQITIAVDAASATSKRPAAWRDYHGGCCPLPGRLSNLRVFLFLYP